jgi:predicted nucleic acid-binding protein
MIISNATPLIAFARIQQLDLLRRTVNELIIPNGVADEIGQHEAGALSGYVRIDFDKEDWIKIQPVKYVGSVDLLLPVLDKGEAEVIALALEQPNPLVLLDELTARKVAAFLKLEVTGSIGVLIRAKQRGDIAAVKPFVAEMIRKGIWYSERFLAAALGSIGESW